MSALATTINFVTLSWMITLYAASTVAGGTAPGESYTDLMDRLRVMRRGETIAHMDKAGKLERLNELEGLGREIERRWRDTEPDKYGRAILEVCAVMGSLDLGDTWKRHGSVTAFATRALEKADQLPLDVECGLTVFLQYCSDDQGNRLQGAVRKNLRKEQTRLLLRALQRVEKAIDRNWDKEDTGVMNVSPPSETGLPSGISPDAIKDPKLRAEYEAAIQANREKIARYNQQVQVRSLKDGWGKHAQRTIITWYMEAPLANEELAQLLQQYDIDSETRQTIMDGVVSKKMPEQLVLPTTTPAAAQPVTTEPTN